MKSYSEALCKDAFEKLEVKEYLCGVGDYVEPPNRYSAKPGIDIGARIVSINWLYNKLKKEEIIELFEKALLEMSEEKETFKMCMLYLMSQLQFEKKDIASFKLNNKSFYRQLRENTNKMLNSMISNHDQELNQMINTIKYQDNYISDYTGYNIK